MLCSLMADPDFKDISKVGSTYLVFHSEISMKTIMLQCLISVLMLSMSCISWSGNNFCRRRINKTAWKSRSRTLFSLEFLFIFLFRFYFLQSFCFETIFIVKNTSKINCSWIEISPAPSWCSSTKQTWHNLLQ